MLDISSQDDDYGSIAFLDGSASLRPPHGKIDGRLPRLGLPRR